MKNIFETSYELVLEARKGYGAVTDDDKKIAVANYRKAQNNIKELGEFAQKIWRQYKDSRDYGNIYLDFHNIILDEEIKFLVDCMRENNVEYFTFSYSGSSKLKTVQLFQKNACALEGLIEINSCPTIFGRRKSDKTHAYLFRI